MSAAMPADPPQLEDLLGEPLRPQVTALRRYVRKTRDVRVAELLSLASEAAVAGDADTAGQHIAAAAALGTGPPAAPAPASPQVPVPRPRAALIPAPVSPLAEPRRTATIIRSPLTGRARVTATDGSSSGDGKHCSWAFIATSGHWGCPAGDYRHDNANGRSGALIAELRAAYLALRCVPGRRPCWWTPSSRSASCMPGGAGRPAGCPRSTTCTPDTPGRRRPWSRWPSWWPPGATG